MSSKQNPLEFILTAREISPKRNADKRVKDFNEIYLSNKDDKLSRQASRCLDCGNPYCEWKCPLHNYIPNWLEQVAQGNNQLAYQLMYETNPLPEICGRVCPQDRLCEKACTINTEFGAVTIGEIEKNISDQGIKNNWSTNLQKAPVKKNKVAIIGAGPGGLACADQLARNGIKPTVYDLHPEIGGLLTFGIPSFKLEKQVIRKRRKYLEDLGVKFKLNTNVGTDITFDQINSEYDCFFLAMGTYKNVTTDIPNINAKGVLQALDYLIGNINYLENFKFRSANYHDLKGKNVIVLGGGDTAMDCVRTAIRQQAKKVTCVYRRDQLSMPGSPAEVNNAQQEGVNFLFNYSPVSVEIDPIEKSVKGINLQQTVLDNDNKIKSLENSTMLMQADTIITAFGFRASPADWFREYEIKVDSSGLIITGKKANKLGACQTTADNVFAGGDMVRGADLVVTAIADGIKAANEMINYLSEKISE